MKIRRGAVGLGPFFLAIVVAIGCGSQEGAAPPVTASIAGGGNQAAPPAEVANRPAESGDAQPADAATQFDPLHPVVEIETSLGTIQVELDAQNSPGTVANFLNYVNEGFYRQTVFHYVEAGTMIVGGGFDADLNPKKTTLPIRNEAHNGLKNTRGTLAMSRSLDSIDSATSQFFINLADNPNLDHQDATPEGYGYCVFGRVVSGMGVADRIGGVATHDQGEFVSTPQEPVVIRAIRQVR
jgi:cyclophilin family peptidyl-prolyl cis-trans isomerase